MTMRAPRGTFDVLPEEAGRYRRLEATARRVFQTYGYGEIRTPLFEETRLFVRSIGEVTDIVEKEMFTLAAKSEEDSLSLRPESTAGIVRAYLQHGYHKTQPFVKLYAMGPMFRYERPQAGRSRQFDQIGVEAIGSADPLVDAETIALACNYFDELGITGYTVRINSIGCPDCRASYRELLKKLLAPRLDKLCHLCKTRYERNVFRVLDCKEPKCREAAADVPPMLEHLDAACAQHFRSVEAGLKAAGVTFLVDGSVVRGFDYYTRTVYEIMHSAVGARSTICGGGRYDNLVQELGGPSLGACGFGIGVVPLLVVMDKLGLSDGTDTTAPDVYVASADDSSRLYAFELAQKLRHASVRAEVDHEGRSLKAQMRQANRMKAPFAAVVGPDEERSRTVQLKDMEARTDRTVSAEELIELLKAGSTKTSFSDRKDT